MVRVVIYTDGQENGKTVEQKNCKSCLFMTEVTESQNSGNLCHCQYEG